MPSHDLVEVFRVHVGWRSEVEPAGAAWHVAGAEAVEAVVEERGLCGSLGRCDPHLGLHAGEFRPGVHCRCQAVEDGVADILREAERLIEGELVHLCAVSGDLGDGERADEAAVREPLLHAAVRAAWLEGQWREPAFRELFGVLLEVVLGVLAGLCEVVDLAVRAEQRVAGVLGIDERGLAALAWRRHHDGVVIIGAGGGVYLAGHVRDVALPRNQRLAEHLGGARHDRPVRGTVGVPDGAAAHACGSGHALASVRNDCTSSSSCGASG